MTEHCSLFPPTFSFFFKSTILFLPFKDMQPLGKHFIVVILDLQPFLQEGKKNPSSIKREDFQVTPAPFLFINVFSTSTEEGLKSFLYQNIILLLEVFVYLNASF